MPEPKTNLDQLMRDPKAAKLLKQEAPPLPLILGHRLVNALHQLGPLLALHDLPKQAGEEDSGEPPAPAAEEESGPSEAPAQPDWSALLFVHTGSCPPKRVRTPWACGGFASPPGRAGTGGESPLSALGSMDPKLLQAAVTLFSEYSAPDDQKTALLNALKPYLKPERQAQVDKATWNRGSSPASMWRPPRTRWGTGSGTGYRFWCWSSCSCWRGTIRNC